MNCLSFSRSSSEVGEKIAKTSCKVYGEIFGKYKSTPLSFASTGNTSFCSIKSATSFLPVTSTPNFCQINPKEENGISFFFMLYHKILQKLHKPNLRAYQ